MAEKVYLAVDLGAESGRVMAGIWNGKKLRLEEINRFPNGGVHLGFGRKSRTASRSLARNSARRSSQSAPTRGVWTSSC